MHRSQLWNQLAMLAGGRAAVELVFQDPTTGASNDLEEATEIAHQMVVSFGMSERLGFMRLGHTGETFLGHELGRTPTYSDDTASVIDDEVRALLDQSQAEADTILLEHRKALDTMAEALLERETLDKDAIDKLLAAVPKWKRTGESSGVIEPAPELDPDDADAPTITAI